MIIYKLRRSFAGGAPIRRSILLLLLLLPLLAACNGDDDSEEGNRRPVAAAGSDREVAVGATVLLDGSASSDPDGDPLLYSWTFLARPAGSAATLSDPQAVRPTFVADVPGAFRLALTVNDGQLSSQPAEVLIRAVANRQPNADAGPDRTVHQFTAVQLQGFASDPDNDPLTFEWTVQSQPVASSITLVDADTLSPTFTPSTTGNYEFVLTARDGKGGVATDTVLISVVSPDVNLLPVAIIVVADPNPPANSPVTLDGSASFDPDGQLVAYRWEMIRRPVGSAAVLAQAATATPFFTPDLAGDYVIQLTVFDQRNASAVDSVIISAAGTSPASLRK